MRILALESSCDESAVAVYDDAAGLLSHEIYSQVDLAVNLVRKQARRLVVDSYRGLIAGGFEGQDAHV